MFKRLLGLLGFVIMIISFFNVVFHYDDIEILNYDFNVNNNNYGVYNGSNYQDIINQDYHSTILTKSYTISDIILYLRSSLNDDFIVNNIDFLKQEINTVYEIVSGKDYVDNIFGIDSQDFTNMEWYEYLNPFKVFINNVNYVRSTNNYSQSSVLRALGTILNLLIMCIPITYHLTIILVVFTNVICKYLIIIFNILTL